MAPSQDALHGGAGAATADHPDIPNPGSKRVPYYTPAQEPQAGTSEASNPPSLFTPLKIRDVTFPNRIMLSPLCQYSADDGHLTEWHMAHLGGIISRGPGLAFVEATSVTPEGRITPEDSGMWKDSQGAALKRIVDFAHSQNQLMGIQLGHAGRKASTVAPWISGGATATHNVGGWPDNVLAPSALPFSDKYPHPHAMTLEQIQSLKESWVAAVKRAVAAGIDVVEIHAAHGYLLCSFLSPQSNQRTDQYGGSFENRVRLLLEVIEETRAVIPAGMPLFTRISATEWLEEDFPNEPSWKLEDAIRLAKLLAGKIDFLDVSSGGNSSRQHIHAGPIQFGQKSSPAFQAPFSIAIKKAVGDSLLVGTVGGIKDGRVAQDLMDQGLDAVFVGRWFQKNPGAVFQFADDLGTEVRMPNQIRWAFAGRGPRK